MCERCNCKFAPKFFVLHKFLFIIKELIYFATDPSADDLIELARTELRRAEEMKAQEDLQDDEIRNRLSKLTEAPPGKRHTNN